jgi:REP element-mobilizing transposase RayT
MSGSHSDKGLERVRRELRAGGVSSQASNPLRSGIHSRGYLPHVKREGGSYFITFRLADSLPQSALLDLKARRERNLESLGANVAARLEADREYRRQMERYLDQGVGECCLARPEIAEMVAEALLCFDGRQYVLDQWVIMPNHVHLVLWPAPGFTVSQILRSRKRQTARKANLILGRTGETFWQPEYYDHWIRDDEEKARIQRYIRDNPVKAGLCKTAEDWKWGSGGFLGKGEAD